MPNYVTLAEFNNALSPKERTELSTDAAEVAQDDTVVTWALESAESLIDTFISTQVSVPMGTPTGFIKQMTLMLGKYYMFVRRGHVNDDLQMEFERIASTDHNKPGFLFLMMQGKLPVTGVDASSDVKHGTRDRAFDDVMLGVQ